MSDINLLLQQVGAQNGSDLHLVVDYPPTLRVSQELRPIGKEKLTNEKVKKLSYSMINNEQIKSFEDEKELDFSYEIGSSRFRVNLHYERGNVACSIRRIPRNVPNREELGLPKVIENFCQERRGLVLVTGPTGSGKSTTQASMIHRVNTTRACHIITIEDPVEYLHKQDMSIIEQREVGLDTNSFTNALKRVLRQDPDVILIGEMRDLETIQIALTAAETGHLVISTLHTVDAAQSIDRIIDVFPPHQQDQIRLQLSLAIKGIVAQQLLPRKDGRGVVPAVEVMIATSAVRNIIRKATTQEIYSIIEIGKQHGMRTMDRSIMDLYKNGVITRDVAVAHASNIEEMKRKI